MRTGLPSKSVRYRGPFFRTSHQICKFTIEPQLNCPNNKTRLATWSGHVKGVRRIPPIIRMLGRIHRFLGRRGSL